MSLTFTKAGVTMNKRILIITESVLIVFFLCISLATMWSQDNMQIDKPIQEHTPVQANTVEIEKPIEKPAEEAYVFPDFYRGIYLNVYSSRSNDRLTRFIKIAKESNVNAFVMDVQLSKKNKCMVPPKHIKLCIDNNIHPIARIVVFESGLKTWPVPKEVIDKKIGIAESACKYGFKEIQFDYIRFNDSRVLRKLTRKKRYEFIEGFLAKAKKRLKKYDAKIAADIFGRIPLNSGDAIGQRMEGLDKVTDIICPMAYPSHYTWSKKMMSNPYYTVFLTSKSARERTKNAEIVTYIQAFNIKVKKAKMSFAKYIEEQVRAVHDSKVRGYIFWNARQVYDTPFNVLKEYYKGKTKTADIKITKDKAT